MENTDKNPVSEEKEAEIEDITIRDNAEPDLPDTAAFEILDVLPEEEEEIKPVKEAAKQPKNGKKIVIIAVAAALLLAGIFWFMNNTPAKKAERAMKEAISCYESGDVNKAKEYVDRVLELDPKNKDLPGAGYEICNAYAELNITDDGEMIDYLKNMLVSFPDSEDEIKDQLTEIYISKIKSYAGSGDFDKAEEWIAKGEEDGLDLEDARERVQKIKANVDALLEFQEKYGNQFYTLLKSNNGREALNLLESKEIKDFASGLIDKGIIFPIAAPTGDPQEYVCFYASSFSQYTLLGVYCGNYQDELRSGTGQWVVAQYNGDTVELGQVTGPGPWSDDRPNGKFDVLEDSSGDGSYYTRLSGNITDGYYDGDFEIDFGLSGTTYYATFKMGEIQILDTTDPNGDANQVFAYNAAKDRWMFLTEGMNTTGYGLSMTMK